MIHTKVFRRYYVVTVLVIAIFVVISFFASNLFMRIAMSHVTPSNFMGNTDVEIFFAHLIEDASFHDRNQAIHHLETIGSGKLPFLLSVVDENGRNLTDSSRPPIEHWNEIKKPTEDFQVVRIDRPMPPLPHFDGFLHPPGPPPMGDHPEGPAGPPGPGGPFYGRKLVKFPGTPIQYLLMSHVPQDHNRDFPRPPVNLFLITTGSLIGFVLIGIGLALYLIFTSLRKKVAMADKVISELQHGHLKARIPITKKDEIGMAMSRFNKMAEEIEHLVEQLRRVEKSRINLLQDLTHDLRTPVGSLKNLLVTIEKKNQPGDAELRQELLSISRNEVDYFERLVEDLLVLAQVSEPRYQAAKEPIQLGELIEAEAQSLSGRSAPEKKKVEILNPQEISISGDIHLLQRLFRNALENAISFAKENVSVSIDTRDNAVKIFVRDDGPGFSQTALKDFGERRVSRVMNKSKGNRLSVGLGSVIMKTVAELHAGKIEARNLVSPTGEVTGAEIEITLPL